jgi:sugar phosphate isomerase/epimerase
MVDYSFITIQKDDPANLLKAGKALRHIHISNPANKRTYAMSDTESDYAAFFDVLKRIGYRGGLSVHGGPTAPEALMNDAARAIAFLRAKATVLAAAAP